MPDPMSYAHRVVGVMVLFVVGSIGTPGTVSAQPRLEGAAGIFGGAHLFSKKLELGAYDDPRETTTPASGVLIGLRFGLTLQPWVALELEAGGMPTQDRRDQMTAFLATYRAHALV